MLCSEHLRRRSMKKNRRKKNNNKSVLGCRPEHLITNSYKAHFTITVSMCFTLVHWSLRPTLLGVNNLLWATIALQRLFQSVNLYSMLLFVSKRHEHFYGFCALCKFSLLLFYTRRHPFIPLVEQKQL